MSDDHTSTRAITPLLSPRTPHPRTAYRHVWHNLLYSGCRAGYQVMKGQHFLSHMQGDDALGSVGSHGGGLVEGRPLSGHTAAK